MSNRLKKLIMMVRQSRQPGGEPALPYLCFEALVSGFRASFTGTGLYYSFNGRDWVELAQKEYTPPIKAGRKIWFKGECPKASTHPYSRGTFITAGMFNISGKMASLEYGDDFIGKTPVNYSFASMFNGNKNVAGVSDDFFDYGSVSTRTFLYTFLASSLKSAKLNAAANGAFQQCFLNSALESVEILNSKLGVETYTSAFQNSKLKMLYLPSKSYANSAYQAVANACSQLESARIDSIRLNSAMLAGAFKDCTMLSKVTLLALTELSSSVSNNWLINVAEDGEIILNRYIDWDPEKLRNGNFDANSDTIIWGIPANWKIKYCDPVDTGDIRPSKGAFFDYVTGYSPLFYLQTDGSQYIDSGVALSDNCEIEITASVPYNMSGARALIGNSEEGSRVILNLQSAASSKSYFGGADFASNLTKYEVPVTYRMDKTGIYVQGEKLGNWSKVPDFDHQRSFYIFAERTDSGAQNIALAGAKIYNIKLRKNNALIADMVPQLNISQNKPGLYDKINNRFLTNIGTGEFIYA